MYLVTGGSGLVGFALLHRLSATGRQVKASYRKLPSYRLPSGIEPIVIESMTASTDWTSALQGVDAVVHCAARVHVMRDDVTNPLDAYRQVNVVGTLNLARQAMQLGVRRFIFVSSIKVNGESTELGQPFCADDKPAPRDPYGVSKLEAEEGLRELTAKGAMELVIIRPPLVYGPGVKANFATMVKWVARGLPLPLGGIRNLRSMVALDNLIDLLVTCVSHPAAAGQIFLVSDDEDVSTTELLRRTAAAMGKPSRLMPAPDFLLKFCASLMGKRDMAQRLCGSLQVDISKTREILDWKPPLSLDQGLEKAVATFMAGAK